MKHSLPGDIERTSLAIIARELAARGIEIPPEHQAVVHRVIHATADFDYAASLRFTPGAAARGAAALAAGGTIVTDTNMALAGVSKPALARLGGAAFCYMADPAVAAAAKAAGTTRGRSLRWATPPPPSLPSATPWSGEISAPPWSSGCRWASSTWWRARSA